MLISHRKQFIFSKTVKTAGTSVESYFEQYCMPKGEWKRAHASEVYVSDTGVIGCRKASPINETWYNHMPAEKIRALIGLDVWDQYFKFTVIRNPFDKLVSGFFWYEGRRVNENNLPGVIGLGQRILKGGNSTNRWRRGAEIEAFRAWVCNGNKAAGQDNFLVDRDKYLIEGVECLDYFIRFENLLHDIEYVCDHLQVDFKPSRLPKFKMGIRHHKVKIQDYYDDETKRVVEEKYAWELERFGYDLPK